MLFQNYYRKKNYSHLKIYSIVFFLIILLGWCWFLIVQKKKNGGEKICLPENCLLQLTKIKDRTGKGQLKNKTMACFHLSCELAALKND